jgi:hypothetical protein
MNTLDVRKYNMLVRVRDFGSAHADLFPSDSLGGRTFAEIGVVVDRLNTSVTSASSGRRAGRQGVAVAREALRGALEAVTRTARGIAVDAPDIVGKFQMPHGQNDHDLATTARRFAEDAAPMAAAFVAHGLATSFIADLQAALATFERALSGRASARGTHVGARAAITAALDLAFAIFPRLDAIVENRIGSDPNLHAAWHLARNVGRRPTKGEKPAPAEQLAATAPAASSTATPAVAAPERLGPTALPPATPAV